MYWHAFNHQSMMMTENFTLPSTAVAMAATVTQYNSCAAYKAAVPDLLLHTVPAVWTTSHYINFLFHNVLLPTICVFGVGGNMLNLVILSQKHINVTLDRMEKSVYVGLIALAVSDLCQCLLFLTFLYKMPEYVRPLSPFEEIHLFFYRFREGLCDIFLFSSTWLTVLMALGRYVAICHPLNARNFVKFKVTVILIVAIFVVSVLVSLPYMWKFSVQDYECRICGVSDPGPDDCDCMIPYRVTHPDLAIDLWMYQIFWFLLEFAVPLVILVYCNICLILSLRQSYRMQREYRATRVQDPSLHITPTLVAVIIFFIVLIAPTEIVKFVYLGDSKLLQMSSEMKTPVTSVTNTLQSLNAAVNFILYCVINVHFRKTMKKMFCCPKRRERHAIGSMRSEHLRTNHTSVMSNIDTDGETEL